ncbi:unnamed protein product, partial [marine sediment metagenome]
DEVANMIDEQLKLVDTNYWELHSSLDLKPVRVTLLSPGMAGKTHYPGV